MFLTENVIYKEQRQISQTGVFLIFFTHGPLAKIVIIYYNMYIILCMNVCISVVCYELFNRYLQHTMKCTHIWIIFTQDFGLFTSFFPMKKKQNKTKTYVKIYPLCRVVSKGHKCIMHKRMKYFLNSLMVLTSRRATLESFSFYRFKYISRFWSVRYFAPVKTQFNMVGKIMFL